MERLNVGVVFGLGQDAGDDPALLGNPQAALGAKGFEVDGLMHPGSMEALRRIFNRAASSSSGRPLTVC